MKFICKKKNIQKTVSNQIPQTLPFLFSDSQDNSPIIMIRKLDIPNRKIMFDRFYGTFDQDYLEKDPFQIIDFKITQNEYTFSYQSSSYLKFIDNFKIKKDFSEGYLEVSESKRISFKEENNANLKPSKIPENIKEQMQSIIIISYNLSHATQNNTASGTEKDYVLWCQAKKVLGKNLSGKDYPYFPSWCTQRGIDGISKFISNKTLDFLLIQEPFSSKRGDRLFNQKDPDNSNIIKHFKLDSDIVKKNYLGMINSLNIYNIKYGSNFEDNKANRVKREQGLYKLDGERMMQSFVSIIYNKRLYNVISCKTSNNAIDGGQRPCLIVIFQNIITYNYCVVTNVHMPHFSNENGLTERTIKIIKEMKTFYTDKIKDKTKSVRYTIGGDFNGRPNQNFFNLVEFPFIKNEEYPKTCCFKGFNKHADIIYDSLNKEVSKIVPGFDISDNYNTKGTNKEYYTGSDHFPVYLELKQEAEAALGKKSKKKKKQRKKKTNKFKT